MQTICNLTNLFCFAAGAISCLLGVWLGARIILRAEAGETTVLRGTKTPSIDQEQTD